MAYTVAQFVEKQQVCSFLAYPVYQKLLMFNRFLLPLILIKLTVTIILNKPKKY